MAGSITLNKASGGQLTIAPEDGTSTETVTIPSVGVGKVLQVVRPTALTSALQTTSTSPITLWEKTVTPMSTNSVFYVISSWNTRNPLYMNAQINGANVNNASSRGTAGSGIMQEYNRHNQQSFHWSYDNTTGNDVTLGENIRSVDGSTYAEIWNYGYMYSLIIEVEAS
jgi:hypothetical protein